MLYYKRKYTYTYIVGNLFENPHEHGEMNIKEILVDDQAILPVKKNKYTYVNKSYVKSKY